MQDSQHILLFDGVCNLCNAGVQFMIRHDPQGKFKYAALQSKAGQAILSELGLSVDHFETFVYVSGDKHYLRSAAGLHILKDLGFPWSIFFPLVVVPPFIRDAFYKLIAKTRYKLFGKRDTCMIPTPDIEQRFL